jgi:hypothetical protein
MKPLTIICMSDTHEVHRELDVPYGDILIHAGGLTMFSRAPLRFSTLTIGWVTFPIAGRSSYLATMNSSWKPIHPGED